MEIVPEKKSKLASAIIWCSYLILLFVAVGVVGVYLENLVSAAPLQNYEFPGLAYIGIIGAFLLSIVSLALGMLANRQNDRGLLTVAGKAAAKRGIQHGILGIMLSLILPAFIPIRERSFISFNEASAIRSLRTIHTAAYAYAKAHPERGFPAALRDLPVSQHDSHDGKVVDDQLVSGYKNGYNFTYTPRSMHNNGKADAYDVSAEPVVPQTTGNLYFFSDETGVVSFSTSQNPAGKKPL